MQLIYKKSKQFVRYHLVKLGKYLLRFNILRLIAAAIFTLIDITKESFMDVTLIRTFTIKDEKLLYVNYNSLKLKEKFQNTFFKNSFLYIDVCLFFIKSFKYNIFQNFNNNDRIDYRLKNTKQGFYLNFINTNKNLFWKNIFLIGFKYIWKGLKFWLFSIIIFFIIFYSLIVIKLLPFNKIVFEWICLGMFFYWIISGFVFFIKKYQFGKYTSVIQRFWRRTYILFWILEACLFIVFFYFTVNASAEPFYMYDQIQFNKNRLFSWRFFLFKLLPLTFLIVIGYIYLLTVRWSIFSKNILFLSLLTVTLTYVIWLEFYQFFHILNFYGNLFWVYDIDEHTWLLENEPRRTRIVNHFNSILMILKFWHIIFIYVFWIFFLLRSYEIKRVRYPLLSANLQNFIILYIFAWVSMYPWIKFYMRKLLDTPYYWFYLNNRLYGFRIFFNDLKLVYFSFTNFNFFKNFYFKTYSFFYWYPLTFNFNFYGFRNYFIKNQILLAIKTP